MMFTKPERNAIEKSFRKTMACTQIENDILQKLEPLSPEEKTCMEFLYAYMPFSDMATYDFILFLSFVRAALRAKDAMPWGGKIPTEIFLNYVLFYRVNNENIEEYRGSFFEEIAPLLKGKSMAQAALEVNYWCFSKATYRPTDERTASPLTVIRTGYGRCGEESTLTVSAMRSVGIPARQCYVPRWSHCDDNHAWVEVWVDGDWHYLGACEPEPVLDKSWFTYAASRAMMVETRAFSGCLTGQKDRFIYRGERFTLLNRLPAYAEVRPVTVAVKRAGKPVFGATVRFEVFNSSEFYPVATLITDQTGKARLLTGKGDLFVHVCINGCFLFRKIDVSKTGSLEFDMEDALSEGAGSCEFEFFPPKGGKMAVIQPDENRMPGHTEKMAKAENVRKKYEDTFFKAESASAFAAKYPDYAEKMVRYLILSRGNRREIASFLENGFDLQIKTMILDSLPDKDFTDATEEVLNEHVRFSLPYVNCCEAAIFAEYVLSPRIGKEPLRKYREAINAYFTDAQKRAFRDNPSLAANYIRSHIKDAGENDYASITAGPAELLRFGVGSALSRRYLFVAVCRTFGIPARIEPAGGEAEYYRSNRWMAAEIKQPSKEDQAGCLVLEKSSNDHLAYFHDYTIGKLVNGIFRTLCYSDSDLPWKENKLKLFLKEGNYRLVTSTRQIDSSVLIKIDYINIAAGKSAAQKIALRESVLQSCLKNMPVRNWKLTTPQGEPTCLYSALPENKPTVLAALQVGSEPTEHLLGEMIKIRDRFIKDGVNILFLVGKKSDLKDQTLLGALSALPAASVLLPGKGDVFSSEALFEDLCAWERKLPLSAVISSEKKARFSFSNYNVGAAALLLQIAEAAE